MSNYLLLYTGGSEPKNEAEGQTVMNAWTSWFNSLGAAVVDGGNPLGGKAKHVKTNGEVKDGAVGTAATGYSIVKADTLDAAAEIAQGCPHLQAGGQISIYEIVPASA
jgi:hypothetical protein